MTTLIRQEISCIATKTFFIVAVLSVVESAKQRSWLGPSQYTQGSPPVPLDSFGFSSVGGKLYVFGGWDTNNGQTSFSVA